MWKVLEFSSVISTVINWAYLKIMTTKQSYQFETIEVYLDAGNHDALTPHSRYIVDFLFCIIWVWLGLCPYSKSRYSSKSFLRYCKLTILGTSGIPGHTSQK